MNAEAFFDWKRFWIPAEREIELTDGYLSDPEEKQFIHYNTEAKPLSSYSDTPCLILLGDRGMGKSCEINRYSKSLDAGGIPHISLDLGRYGNELRLSRDIFEDVKFTKWREGDASIEIVLDSLDECLVEIPKVTKMLVDELAKLKRLSGLRLLVTCRGTSFPDSFRNEIQNIWGGNNVAVLKLAPLRKIDVKKAAEKFGDVSSDEFLKLISKETRLEAWASNPLTLNMLLEEFAENRLSESTSQTDLFSKYCLFLCKDRYAVGLLEPVKRLAAAKWIAAAMIFCNKSEITLQDQIEADENESTDISLLALVAKPLDKLDIKDTYIQSALQSGLFKGSEERRSWAHKGYCEFLAAKFIHEQNVNKAILRGLFFNNEINGREPSLVPQLFETANWLAELREDFLSILLESDPLSLLKSPIGSFGDVVKIKIVDNILNQANKNLINDMDIYLREHYQKLNYANLADNLKPYIISEDKHFVARRMAIDIAEACKVASLLPDLLKLALNKNDRYMRQEAVHAIKSYGDKEHVEKLRPLLDLSENDPEDELRGSILSALWPDYMDDSELFKHITPPKRSNLYGQYKHFLTETVPEKLRIESLPIALAWVESLDDKKPEYESARKRLAGKLLYLAWENFYAPGILEPLARISFDAFKNHESVLGDRILDGEEPVVLNDINKRRTLALEIFKLIRYPEDIHHWEVMSLPRYLFREEDFNWAIDQLLAAQEENHKNLWSITAFYLFNRDDAEHIERIYNLKDRFEELKKRCVNIFGPIAIEGDEAVRLRKYYELSKNRQQKDSPPLDYEAMVRKRLNDWEKNDLNAWWLLCRDLKAIPRTNGRYEVEDEFEADLTLSKGWESIDDELRKCIIELAQKHIKLVDPKPEEWFGKDIFHRPAAAGYYALWLLRKEERQAYEMLNGDIWAKWAPIVVGFPNYPTTDHDDPITAIAKDCYQKARTETIRYIKELLRKENGYLSLKNRFELCVDDALTEVFVEYVKSFSTNFEGVEDVLNWLCKFNNSRKSALNSAKEILSERKSENEVQRKRASSAGAILLLQGSDAEWKAINSILHESDNFTKELLMQAGHMRDYHKSHVAELSETSLKELYLELVSHFPHSKDEKYEGAHFVGLAEQASHFRDNVLGILIQKGTKQAIDSLVEIADSLDSQQINGEYIRLQIPAARTNLLIKSWHPKSPSELIALLSGEDEAEKYANKHLNKGIAIFAIIAAILSAIVIFFMAPILNPILKDFSPKYEIYEKYLPFPMFLFTIGVTYIFSEKLFKSITHKLLRKLFTLKHSKP